MDKLQRVRAALAGAVVDRPPYAFWTHLPGTDLDPRALADATAAFARRYDLDFVKSMPNGLYVVEDWGAETDYSDIARGGVARVTRPAVSAADDWPRLARVEVNDGAFGRELTHLARLVPLVGANVPVLATVFSPLTIAGKLSNGLHREHVVRDAAKLAAGLETITEATCAFARAAIERGCAGIFLAVQDAAHGVIEEASYRLHGEPYDRRVLAAARDAGAWFNVVHMHGERVWFDLLSRYDVAALNWHIGETPPSIAEYRAHGSKPIVGGMQRGHLTRGDHAAIRADIETATRQTNGRGLLLAPACVIRHPVDDAVLTATAAFIRDQRSFVRDI
jgi:uroporphyrinogen decarboxylase